MLLFLGLLLPISSARAATLKPELPKTSFREPLSLPLSSSSEKEQQISPSKLALFAKALEEIVESRCPSADDLQLDSFQAYLNRQILKGDVQTFKQPWHFNSLFRNLTGCAAKFLQLSSPLNQNRKSYVDSNKNSKVAAVVASQSLSKSPSSSTALSSSSPTRVIIISEAERNKATTTTTTPIPTKSPSSAIKPSNRSAASTITTASTTRQPTIPPTANNEVSVGNNRGEPEEVPSNPENTTNANVSSKAPNKATTTTTTLVKKFTGMISKLFKKVSGWFRRTIRDITSGGKSGDKGEYYLYYLRNMGTEQPSRDPFLHMTRILTNIKLVALQACHPEYPLEKEDMSTVVDIIMSLALEGLIPIENNGMYLTINSRLEDTLNDCLA